MPIILYACLMMSTDLRMNFYGLRMISFDVLVNFNECHMIAYDLHMKLYVFIL